MKKGIVSLVVGSIFWFSGFGIAADRQQQQSVRSSRNTQSVSRQQIQRGSRSNYQQSYQQVGYHQGGYYPPERTDWQNLYYGRRPDPPSGLQYRWANTPLGPRSVPVSFDRLPPPHFYHHGHPGYNTPGGQQVVIINNNNGGPPTVMDYRTGLVIEAGQTLRMILAYLFSPKPAQAAQPVRQAPPPQTCSTEPRDPCAPQGERQSSPGIYLVGGSDDVRTAVEKELLERGAIIVANRNRAGRQLTIRDTIYGDPWIRIELRLIDLRTSQVISATDGTRQFATGNNESKYAATRGAAQAAVKDLNL